MNFPCSVFLGEGPVSALLSVKYSPLAPLAGEVPKEGDFASLELALAPDCADLPYREVVERGIRLEG
jgi:hypothetical protein